jgi:hypothetical protein
MTTTDLTVAVPGCAPRILTPEFSLANSFVIIAYRRA